MKNLVLLWRRLFHRHEQHTQSPVSRGLAAYLSTSWRREAAFAQDFADDPMMCEPDIRSKRTARITRIIETKTRPLPTIDDEAPTQGVPGWQFYVEDTMREIAIDEYATRPMSLAEIMR